MCGHGIIAMATVAVETGMVRAAEPETVLRIDSPAGLVTAHVRVTAGRAKAVRFRNVPSFVLALDQAITLPGIGEIRYDLAFGGAFYAYVSAAQLGLRCLPEELPVLVEKGMAIKRAVVRERPVEHPAEPDLSFLYGTIFIAPALNPGGHSQNGCVCAEGEVDRSPTGTGVSGRLALHHARKQIGVGEPLVIESVIGSRFCGRVVETTEYCGRPAVIPEVEGSAYLTGRAEFWLDPDDPLRHGVWV
jgi:proline racemase